MKHIDMLKGSELTQMLIEADRLPVIGQLKPRVHRRRVASFRVTANSVFFVIYLLCYDLFVRLVVRVKSVSNPCNTYCKILLDSLIHTHVHYFFVAYLLICIEIKLLKL